ncbi:3-deoxy-D-manno-octulosonate cytidylyltransferase [Candidatus Blochmanniella vafra str. BVAF]|uniref:3-deoxy-manno-octulosonate cytidylyltransferase n=1 Tax=Blochmanniella vafra (strain BVAF) TaxID=859654 RepID=E8Q678_BLOVB|nr:3-deoxy-manno-octulosonate cytidylyltransferase [Candidatus Blochmannia vafer]ADV33772.1 3-deoxy-D-manno-octulosonate cytidylyltransferase [Candidatus Blochmannia vafer str. BVAF]
MNFIIIIPARFFSTRFPGKLLADIQGKPMIIRVIEQALTSQASKIIVAVDNIRIQQVIESEYSLLKDKVEVCLTKSTHKSGTERLLEVVTLHKFKDKQIIVHLQGDEPLISSFMIHQVVRSIYAVSKKNNIRVATLASPIKYYYEVKDCNIVKVVINMYNNALYFSRSMIPWVKENNYSGEIINSLWLRHIGVYAYRADFLQHYSQWDKSPLEEFENLEQLRVLWIGETIHVSIIHNNTSNIISVDTVESLKYVNKLFLKKQANK